MDFKGSVNQFRKIFMNTLTNNIGQKDKTIESDNSEIKNVLICRPNSRLGNQILITPIVQEVSERFPNSKIDLFVRGGAAIPIFKNYKNIDLIIKLPQKPFKQIPQYLYVWYALRRKKYDLVINIDCGSSSGKLATKWSNSNRKIFGIKDPELKNTHPDYEHMAKMSIYNLRNFLHSDYNSSLMPLLDIKLDAQEIQQGKEVLAKLVKNNKPTICIYTYATGQKCYSKEWWANLYEQLDQKYKQDYNIIEILPKEKISQIDFKTLSFYSTDLREMAALMANTDLFIGADCGIMHLATSSGVPTIGLFSVSNLNDYQPYGARNSAINTNKKSFENIVEFIDSSLRKSTSSDDRS